MTGMTAMTGMTGMMISAVATRRDRRLSFVGVAFIFRSREFRIYDGGRDLLFFSSEVMSV